MIRQSSEVGTSCPFNEYVLLCVLTIHTICECMGMSRRPLCLQKSELAPPLTLSLLKPEGEVQ